MRRAVLASVLRRFGRSFGLFAALALTTGSFVVLTGSVSSAQLQVRSTVQSNYRAAYDILVRPRGARSTEESSNGLVRANFLSGQFGGITVAQYNRIEALSGVEVAAPVAMIGFVLADVDEVVDVTDLARGSRGRPVLRTAACWSRGNGRDGQGWTGTGLPEGHVGAIVERAVPFLVAAVDPKQEARLVGLDKAIVRGEYLPPHTDPRTPGQQPTVPVIVANQVVTDDVDVVSVRRLSAGAAARMGRGL